MALYLVEQSASAPNKGPGITSAGLLLAGMLCLAALPALLAGVNCLTSPRAHLLVLIGIYRFLFGCCSLNILEVLAGALFLILVASCYLLCLSS